MIANSRLYLQVLDESYRTTRWLERLTRALLATQRKTFGQRIGVRPETCSLQDRWELGFELTDE